MITKIIIVVMGIIVIYMIILKILGHSPTSDQIMIGLIAVVGTAQMNLYYKFGRHEGKVNEFIRISRNTFSKIRKDLDKIKSKL